MRAPFLPGRRTVATVAAGVSLLSLTVAAGLGPAGAATGGGRLDAVPGLSVAGGAPVVFSPGAPAQPVAPITVSEANPGVLSAGSTICLVLSGAAFTATAAPTVTTSDSGALLQASGPQFVAISVTKSSSGTGATIATGGLSIDASGTAGPVEVNATLLQVATAPPPAQGNAPLHLDASSSQSPCLIDPGVSGALEIGTVPLGSVVSQTRIFGTDRYDTAATLFLGGPVTSFGAAGTAAVAAAGSPAEGPGELAATWDGTTPSCHTVAVIASGDNYPDALAANYLAGRSGLSTQILLAEQGSLPSQTAAALRLAGVSEVVIVGGPLAVGDAVANQLAGTPAYACGGTTPTGNTISVSRIAGPTRFDTAAAVAQHAGAGAVGTLSLTGQSAGAKPTAIVANGDSFADALSAGPMAYGGTASVTDGNGHGFPLLLTNPTTLSPQAEAALKALGIGLVLIPGGPAAVSTAVEQQIDALGITTLRFAGTDRTDTAALVATFETTAASAAPQSGLAYSTAAVDLVRGDTFADALTVPGYAWSIGTGTPLLMAINPTDLGAATAAYLKRTGAAPPMPGLGTGTINVFGGPGALSTAVVEAAAAALAGV